MHFIKHSVIWSEFKPISEQRNEAKEEMKKCFENNMRTENASKNLCENQPKSKINSHWIDCETDSGATAQT